MSLSSDGSVVAVGAFYNDGNGTDSGHTRVYGNLSTYANTFLGTTNTNWDTSSNWSKGIVPNNDNAIIKAGQTVNATNSISVKKLTLESNSALTVGLNVNNSAKITLASSSSLIAQNSIPFDFTYLRYLETNNWYLISSPTINETIENFILKNNLATGTGNNLGIGDYNNTSKSWIYGNSGTTGVLESGDGRAVKLAEQGNITFTGTMPLNDKNILISNGAPNGNGFNLIGNPFPSYITANHSSPSTTNNLLSINTNLLEEQTIWFWDQEEGRYIAINQAVALVNGIRYIPPGQGFFVKSKSTVGNFLFPESLQSHQSTDVFGKTNSFSENYTHIQLKLNSSKSISSTSIIYMDKATLGWDNGLDATVFNGFNNSFNIYSVLIENDLVKKLEIQSIPHKSFDEVIAIGVNGSKDSEIYISAVSKNLPDSYQIYLEDKLNKSFTLLDNSSNYKTTLQSDLNGTSRYFLHIRDNPISIDDNYLNTVNIFSIKNNSLQILGLENSQMDLFLFDINGKEVFHKELVGSSNDIINHSQLETGIYVVKLQNGLRTITKKLVIK